MKHDFAELQTEEVFLGPSPRWPEGLRFRARCRCRFDGPWQGTRSDAYESLMREHVRAEVAA